MFDHDGWFVQPQNLLLHFTNNCQSKGVRTPDTLTDSLSNTRELYSINLRAVGPNHAQLKTKQNRTRQQNKTQGSKQVK